MVCMRGTWLHISIVNNTRCTFISFKDQLCSALALCRTWPCISREPISTYNHPDICNVFRFSLNHRQYSTLTEIVLREISCYMGSVSNNSADEPRNWIIKDLSYHLWTIAICHQLFSVFSVSNVANILLNMWLWSTAVYRPGQLTPGQTSPPLTHGLWLNDNIIQGPPLLM